MTLAAVTGLAQRLWRAWCLPWLCVCAWLWMPSLHAAEWPQAQTPPQDTPQPAPPDAPQPPPSTGRGLSLPSERPAVHWPGDFNPPASNPNPIGLRASPDALPGPATGLASWYSHAFEGRRTASGEPYSRYEMTAAHRTLPLGTLLHVTNPDTGVGVLVRINDRGPFHGNRLIDLSHAAASALGIVAKGVGRVDLRLPSDDEAAEFASRLAGAAKLPPTSLAAKATRASKPSKASKARASPGPRQRLSSPRRR